MKKLLQQLRAELETSMPSNPPRSPTDGLYLREFFINFHLTLYKWRKYGNEIIGEHNFRTRIEVLKECDEIKNGGAVADDPKVKELNEEY